MTIEALPPGTVTWSALWAVVGVLMAMGGAVATCVGWLWNKFRDQEKDLAEFKLEVAKDARAYATNDALLKTEDKIEAALNRLSDRFERGFDRVVSIMQGHPVKPIAGDH